MEEPHNKKQRPEGLTLDARARRTNETLCEWKGVELAFPTPDYCIYKIRGL